MNKAPLQPYIARNIVSIGTNLNRDGEHFSFV